MLIFKVTYQRGGQTEPHTLPAIPTPHSQHHANNANGPIHFFELISASTELTQKIPGMPFFRLRTQGFLGVGAGSHPQPYPTPPHFHTAGSHSSHIYTPQLLACKHSFTATILNLRRDSSQTNLPKLFIPVLQILEF